MTDKKQPYKQFKPDPTAVGEQVNGLMLYVHNRTAQDIVSAIQSLILEPYEQNLELTADQIHIAALQKARDIAKSFIKESITLKK
jgi:hypothetical protein